MNSIGNSYIFVSCSQENLRRLFIRWNYNFNCIDILRHRFLRFSEISKMYKTDLYQMLISVLDRLILEDCANIL